ncbi:hypothetical protein [Pseudomonas fluorescens]|uniref:Uncharacterized protein n=1 Tax=Pseudomonas fluorescens TaxID=294 RepID=A0A944E2J7_PSEFL|nr:hypothetical protein [Pseudomonas fluorescens]MBT2295266.1 hypothetical protein [Pseudomonas fluorescens]MBT2309054.1 hypothetical protein [Pseudomonas fluorescens]MBT2312193.1 hypothetical protein [Pseudomonas fluorescens]MBT2318240.1 hypothetical protein [Pseudomonas fluorescens]MBT2331266.1 hypothetical protein [Pseudomonas fluorescens]
MNDYGLYALAYAVFLLLFFYMKPYGLRQWLGIALVALGFASIFALPSFISGFDLGIVSTSAIGIGAALFFSRGRYKA